MRASCYSKQVLISILRDMARAYAIELRLRVIKTVEAGIRISKVSKLFNVSRDTIYKWKKLKDRQRYFYNANYIS